MSNLVATVLLGHAPHFEEYETPEPSLRSLIYRYYRDHFTQEVADGFALRYIESLIKQGEQS